MVMIIGIGKNNCTCSEQRKGKQLHLDTSVLFPSRTKIKIRAIERQKQGRKKTDT